MLRGKKGDTFFPDLDETVRCSFKNLTAESSGILQNRIKRFITNDKFDSDGLASCVSNRRGTNEMSFKRQELNTIRDNLNEILTEAAASVWFSIDNNPFHGLCSRSLDGNDPSPPGDKDPFGVGCHFGSMFSHRQFYSHETNNNKIMDITFERAFHTIERIHIRLNSHQFVVIDIDSIQMGNILINHTIGASVHILFPLKYSPKIFEMEGKEADGNNRKKKRICADSSNAMINNIAMCSDVVFSFSSRDPTIWIYFLQHLIPVQEKGHLINFSTFQVLEWEKARRNHSTPDPFDYKNASFKDRYGLLVLTSLGDVFRDKWALTTDNELRWNEWKPADRYEMCCFVAEQLYKDHGYDLRKAKDDFRERKNERKVQDKISSIQIDVKPENRLEIACCSLTPLRIIFKPLEVTTGCRVLRRSDFGGKKNFLLVHFREEDKTNIKVNDASIRKYLKGKMIDGIQLFSQQFKYFGASTSQMKEYSFWFINTKFQSGDVLQAYNRLGNFQAIKNIATYVARIGQYFSGTIPIDTRLTPYDPRRHSNGNPNDPFYREIPDVEFNGKNFTDGIGKISWGLAGRIAMQLNIELFDKEDIPSAFQIRVAGCKGMVAIDPKSSMDEFYIEIRPSMKKFESDDWTLEICEVSRELPLVFNKQVIRLLEDLKNDFSSFETYQKLALGNWMLTANNPSLIDIGLNKRIAYLSGKEALVDVKIPIPSKEGRTLFGVVDESDTLEYGQCFIQYSITDAQTLAKRFVVHTGDVIVTKNPCLWPGDVRRLTAVKNDRLKSCMRDVIVFPRKGKRPHPNEMAGSDLDGDQYWVYWGNGFQVRQMIEPLSYESSKKAETSSISYEDIINHIIDQFGDSGIVGQICNLHTLIADKHKDHSLSDECKALAEMFSIAVDAPKTGKTIKPDELKPFRNKYSGSYPRFMWKRFGPFYESQSVTERLFLVGRQYYFEMRESHRDDVPKQSTGRRDPAPRRIQDESFRKWLERHKSENLRKDKDDGEKKAPQRRSNKARGATKPSENSSEESDDDENEKKVRRRTSAARKGTPDKAKVEPAAEKKAPQRRIGKAKGQDDDDDDEEKDYRQPSAIPKGPSNKLKFETGEEKKAPQRRMGKAKGRDDEDDDDEEEEKDYRQPSAIPKDRPKKVEKPVLINTDIPSASASASSSSSFLSIPPEQNCSNDFIFGVAARIIATSAVKFTNDASPNLIIHLGKSSAEADRLDNIVEKLVSTFEKYDIFKTKSNCYKAQEHGPLRLVAFYGQIQFVGSTEWPLKYGDVSKLIKSNSDPIVQFVDADLSKLQFDQKNPSAKKKDAIEYEFECCFRSCPTEIISLLFDASKNILKIEISFVWNKCYVRQPNFPVDTMFEIRSTIVHNSDSSAFRFVIEKIFKSQDKIDFLTGRKPNVGIQTNLLKSDVKPLRLKHFEEERTLSTVGSSIKSFYRRCEYLPVDQPTNASNRLPRLEFHAEGITKDKDNLKSIFSDALAPVE